jgi:hypothetical protein
MVERLEHGMLERLEHGATLWKSRRWGGSGWLEYGMAIVKLQRVMTSCETRSRDGPPGG